MKLRERERENNIMNLPRCSPCLTLMILATTAILFTIYTSTNLKAQFFADIDQELIIRDPKLTGNNYPPIFAYWIFGSPGEYKRIIRLLKAIYHPRNQYLLHLDSGATRFERWRLENYIKSNSVFREFNNVAVIRDVYPVDLAGPSAVAAVLHAAALLLRVYKDWDWFVPLYSADYPLVTQNDLLYAFSSLPRDINFIEQRNQSESKMENWIETIVVDPNLQMKEKDIISYSNESRTPPDDFEIYSGSQWMILSRNFMEHCILSYENLPRKLLLYFTNVVHPMQSYFHTIIYNTPKFQNKTVNSDLRFEITDQNQNYYELVESGFVFAGPFEEVNDSLIRRIDDDILKKNFFKCLDVRESRKLKSLENECMIMDDIINAVKEEPSGQRLRSFVSELLSNKGL
ncbi:hypothetical protein LUZ60_006964 [Juncus effusus]|nr:hypothetical protein LUZ60_006964 [Juncus effusus]